MKLETLIVFIALVLVVAASFITIDWSGFFYGEEEEHQMFPSYDRRTKWVVSLLCSLIVWLAAGSAWNDQDRKRMVVIFIATILADTCLVLLSILGNLTIRTLGIVIFFVAHFLLIRRNLHGARNLWNARNIVTAVVILLLSASFLIFVLRPILIKESILFIFGIVYISILSVSLWAAWCTPTIGYLPAKNALLTVIGLSCFYLCDLTVIFGIATTTPNAVLPPLGVETIYLYPAWDGLRFIVSDLTWMFYTPALLLLALGVYKPKVIMRFADE